MFQTQAASSSNQTQRDIQTNLNFAVLKNFDARID